MCINRVNVSFKLLSYITPSEENYNLKFKLTQKLKLDMNLL